MTDKSHVGMGFELCPVCGTKHSEAVLLHRFLKPNLTDSEFMGWAMCEEHLKLFNDGYIALIEVSNPTTSIASADRTGNLAHVRAEVFIRLFNQAVPNQGICFVEKGVIDQLQQIIPTKDK
jgi:hypothetical protein